MKKQSKQSKTAAAALERPRIEQPQQPSANAEEIAQSVITKVLARKFYEYQRQHATILAMRRMLAEHGIPDAEYYDGQDRRDGGRCPVCYRTGERILDWGVCREHSVRWSLKTCHFENCALVPPIQVPSQEVEEIESFHEVDPAYEPRPLWDRNHTEPLIEEIDDELTQAVRDNPPTDEMIAKEHEILKWLAARRVEALKIDPATAEGLRSHTYTIDPYGIDPDLPEKYQQVGSEIFVRRPGSDIWVWFYDLPKATIEALEKRGDEECRREVAELPESPDGVPF
jgi:hypothetical protein